MFRKWFLLSALLLVLPVIAYPQGTVDKNGAPYPTEEELAQRKRLAEILKHPTFITLRLLSTPRDVPREKSTDTPAPYKFKDWIGFRLLVSQSLFEDISVAIFRNLYYEVRPVLARDGEIIPHSKKAEASVERADFLMPPASELKLKPGAEYDLQEIRIDDWYEPLPPGRYELTVRRRFDWQGDWLTSSPIYFEVQPRTSSAIPKEVAIELEPEGLQPNENGTYTIASDIYIKVFVVNNSDKPLKVSVADRYYSVRPELSGGGALLSYRAGTEKLIAAKDESPSQISLANDFFLDPGTRTQLAYIKLDEWYDHLPAGSYRLVTRYRFEIEGPWTAESAPLMFEVRASKRN